METMIAVEVLNEDGDWELYEGVSSWADAETVELVAQEAGHETRVQEIYL